MLKATTPSVLTPYEALIAKMSFTGGLQKLSALSELYLNKNATNIGLFVAKQKLSVVLMKMDSNPSTVQACIVQNGKLVKVKHGGIIKRESILTVSIGIRSKYQTLFNQMVDDEHAARTSNPLEYDAFMASIVTQALEQAGIPCPEAKTSVPVEVVEGSAMLTEVQGDTVNAYFTAELLKDSKTAVATQVKLPVAEAKLFATATPTRDSKEEKDEKTETLLAQIKTQIGRAAKRMPSQKGSDFLIKLNSQLQALQKNHTDLFLDGDAKNNSFPHMHGSDVSLREHNVRLFLARNKKLMRSGRFRELLETRVYLLEELQKFLKMHESLEFSNNVGKPISVKNMLTKDFPDTEENRKYSPTYKLSIQAELKQEVEVLNEWLARIQDVQHGQWVAETQYSALDSLIAKIQISVDKLQVALADKERNLIKIEAELHKPLIAEIAEMGRCLDIINAFKPSQSLKERQYNTIYAALIGQSGLKADAALLKLGNQYQTNKLLLQALQQEAKESTPETTTTSVTTTATETTFKDLQQELVAARQEGMPAQLTNDALMKLCAWIEKDVATKKDALKNYEDLLNSSLATGAKQHYIQTFRTQALLWQEELQQHETYLFQLWQGEGLPRLDSCLDGVRSVLKQLTKMTTPEHGDREFIPKAEAAPCHVKTEKTQRDLTVAPHLEHTIT